LSAYKANPMIHGVALVREPVSSPVFLSLSFAWWLEQRLIMY
jgi:hypothetical protein